MLDLTTALYDNVYGISCVENSLLAWLKFRGLPYQSLYCRSYADINTVINEFCERKLDYLGYRDMDRLQSVAQDIGLCDLSAMEIQPGKLLPVLEEVFLEGKPLFIEVDSGLLQKKFNITPRQREHGLLAYKILEGEVYLLDDYPIREIRIKPTELDKIAFRHVIVFNENSFDPDNYFNEFGHVIKCIKAFETQQLSGEFGVDTLLFLRDAVGILRISRSRVYEWLVWMQSVYHIYIEKECYTKLQELIRELNRMFSVIELYRMKGRDIAKDIPAMIAEANRLDEAWKHAL